MNRTIAIDFDGVIHAYSKGWQDGSCYDKPVDGCFEAIQKLIADGNSVFIFSTRKPKQIIEWMKNNCYESELLHNGIGHPTDCDWSYPKYGFKVERIPFWTKFWNKRGVVGVTTRKLPAICYIDDRALKFEGNWQDTITQSTNFKTYQQ